MDDNTRNPRPPSVYGGAIAAALTYEPGRDNAPRVVAAGRGTVAEQILNIAFASGIRVREDADLAQLLAALDIDAEIPVESFAAVAEILAYIYRANLQAAADSGGSHVAPSPEQRRDAAPDHASNDHARHNDVDDGDAPSVPRPSVPCPSGPKE